MESSYYSWLAEYMSGVATEDDAESFAEHLIASGWHVPVTRPGIAGTTAIVDERGDSITDFQWESEMMKWRP